MRVDLPSLLCILFGFLWTFAILCSGPSSSATAATATATPVDRIVVVVRHGDRSPLQPFPWDGKVWQQQGYGHLTNNGKRRMYRLGAFLRSRYSASFPDAQTGTGHIRPRDVYVRSSGIERCLETAQLITAGLVPPQGAWKWSSESGTPDNSNLGSIWQPVPVHSAPQAEDGLLVPGSNCKRAIALYGRIPEAEVVKRYMAPFEGVLASVSNATGVKVTSYREARAVYDSLLSARHHLKEEALPNYQLFKAQSWATSEQLAALKAIFETSFQFDYSGAIEPELVRLRAGLLLREIFSRLEHSNSTTSTSTSTSNGLFCGHRRLTIFSTHDSALSYLLEALGLRPAHTLTFGATLLFEASYHQTSSAGSPTTTTEVALYQIQAARSTEEFSPVELHFPFLRTTTGTGSSSKRASLEQLRAHYGPLLVDSAEQWRLECDRMDGGLDEEKLKRGRAEL